MFICLANAYNNNTDLRTKGSFFIPSGVDLTRIFFDDVSHLFWSLETIRTGS